MSAVYKDEETLKAELRELTAATRALREELCAELDRPPIGHSRALRDVHSGNPDPAQPTIARPGHAADRPAELRAKARDVRARSARGLMKARAARERADRAATRLLARNKAR